MRFVYKEMSMQSKNTVDKIAVPIQSQLHALSADADFQDAYQLDGLPATTQSALQLWLQHIVKTPRWVETMMRLRNALVARLGLKNLGELSAIDPAKPANAYRVGERLGIFTILNISHDELVLGDFDQHLNVRVSLLVQNLGQTVTVSTLVHEHNLLGRLYMLFVKPMHRLIAPAMLKKFAV